MLTQEAIRLGLAKPKTKADEEMAANYRADQVKAGADNKAAKEKEGNAFDDEKAKAKADKKAAAEAKAAEAKKHPMMPDLDNMKMPDLKALAKGMGISVGFGTLKKSLIKTLKAEYKKAAQQGT